jgi:GT2 family glycosyltransferase
MYFDCHRASPQKQERAMKRVSPPNAADILIPVRNQYAKTRALLESVYRYTDFPFQIYVLDHGSTDETLDLGKIYTKDITLVKTRRKRNWTGAINHGIRIATNPFVVILSNDVEISQGWLGNMISFLKTHPRIAAVGPLESSPGRWQCIDSVREKLVPQIPAFFTDDLHERNRILQYHFKNTGILVDQPLALCCAAMTRRAVDRIGLLSESGKGEADADYCRRLREAGYVLGLALNTCVRLKSTDK